MGNSRQSDGEVGAVGMFPLDDVQELCEDVGMQEKHVTLDPGVGSEDDTHWAVMSLPLSIWAISCTLSSADSSVRWERVPLGVSSFDTL